MNFVVKTLKQNVSYINRNITSKETNKINFITVGSAFIREASALATPTLIAIVVSCIVFILFVGLLLMFCRCKRNQTKKSQSKDYEMDSVRPTIVTQQNQAPPPYYPSTGMENKALEHSLDLALTMDDQKNVYATQNGYGYHVANPDLQQHQNINNSECKLTNVLLIFHVTLIFFYLFRAKYGIPRKQLFQLKQWRKCEFPRFPLANEDGCSCK